ncbi:uncharacterized protein K489DRAFT_163600 [Dissoconium aciculare CBS 342.82]|jgi:hypothetical protein|uniref:Uncharacterized protein n=1 Tax=Dissoconium aciculare CBS 342.82 TaxID=1314786 RepID=A0A6J3MFI6_9PEZI|nr:uncharacterized protein K489DRAFT_163600 [Dissoconium aciculare CBS 342.82]KAF1825637.1 hypothetical protein K489DRAFT_163600 [Dissoconium aciculare CBS 342.82]
MSLKMNLIRLAVFFATTAVAAPTASASDEPICEGNYLVEKWGKVVAQPTYNSTYFGEFRGCQSSGLARRADYDTKVEAGDDSWNDGYIVDQIKPPHDELWDRVLELCYSTSCDGEKSITVDNQEKANLVMSMDGNFADSALRDDFLALIKEAFYRALEETSNEVFNQAKHVKGPGYLHATSGYGDASGFYLTMRMHTESPEQPGCPAWVNAINAAGALVPQLSGVFGVAGAICAALD